MIKRKKNLLYEKNYLAKSDSLKEYNVDDIGLKNILQEKLKMILSI
jgi:hypothetical protein